MPACKVLSDTKNNNRNIDLKLSTDESADVIVLGIENKSCPAVLALNSCLKCPGDKCPGK